MEVTPSAGPSRTPQLGTVTLGMRPIPSTIVANGTVVRPQHGAHDDTLGVTENVRLVEGLRFTIVLTELAEVPDDNVLTIGGLHDRWRFQ